MLGTLDPSVLSIAQYFIAQHDSSDFHDKSEVSLFMLGTKSHING